MMGLSGNWILASPAIALFVLQLGLGMSEERNFLRRVEMV